MPINLYARSKGNTRKPSDDTAQQIYDTDKPIAALAKQFGVSASTVRKIKNRTPPYTFIKKG